MKKDTPADYDKFYEGGGWQYEPAAEYMFLVYRLLQPVQVPPGGHVLELGCGTGLHASLFHQLDFRVTAIDLSSVAIEKAKVLYPGPQYICGDAHQFISESAQASYELVFVRGLSWFHYELAAGENRFGVNVQDETDAILRVLRPGGYFVLQMRTDFSGLDCPQTHIRNHTWYDIMALLEPRGRVVLFTDWSGLPLINAETARKSKRNALCVLQCP
jgi:SAM-dependent methyltransferase